MNYDTGKILWQGYLPGDTFRLEKGDTDIDAACPQTRLPGGTSLHMKRHALSNLSPLRTNCCGRSLIKTVKAAGRKGPIHSVCHTSYVIAKKNEQTGTTYNALKADSKPKGLRLAARRIPIRRCSRCGSLHTEDGICVPTASEARGVTDGRGRTPLRYRHRLFEERRLVFAHTRGSAI